MPGVAHGILNKMGKQVLIKKNLIMTRNFLFEKTFFKDYLTPRIPMGSQIIFCYVDIILKFFKNDKSSTIQKTIFISKFFYFFLNKKIA